MNTHVTFTTAVFETKTPQANFINPCCFGEDCAKWLAAELTGKGLAVAAVVQEDWGWIFTVTVDGRAFWVGVGSLEEEADQWLVFCDSRLSFFKKMFGKADEASQRLLCNTIDDVLKSTSHVSEVQWYSKDSWMSGGKEWSQTPA